MQEVPIQIPSFEEFIALLKSASIVLEMKENQDPIPHKVSNHAMNSYAVLLEEIKKASWEDPEQFLADGLRSGMSYVAYDLASQVISADVPQPISAKEITQQAIEAMFCTCTSWGYPKPTREVKDRVLLSFRLNVSFPEANDAAESAPASQPVPGVHLAMSLTILAK